MDNKNYDFSQIFELNYKTTEEEEAQIEQYKQEIIKMGYESFEVGNDFHQFFWELGRKGLICTLLMRIAVIDLISNVPIIPIFLGMAKRYNGWIQHQINMDALGLKQERWGAEELEKKDQTIDGLQKKLSEAKEELTKCQGEISRLQKLTHSLCTQEELNRLRHDIKVERRELKKRYRVARSTAWEFMKMLRNPESRFFKAYDLTKEEDIRKYIVWFQLMKQEIKDYVLDRIKNAYPDDGSIDAFLEAAKKYNEEWQNKFISEEEEDEEEGDEETA